MRVTFNSTKLAAGMRPCRMVAATLQPVIQSVEKKRTMFGEKNEQNTARDDTGSGVGIKRLWPDQCSPLPAVSSRG
jgi:hypothetical protein